MTRTISHSPASEKTGFTIVELLISMTVIFILITTAVVAFRTVRKSAARTEPLSNLRQMMVAYNTYAQEHKGRLMPGYIHPDELPAPGQPLAPGQLDIRVRLPNIPNSLNNELQPGDAAPYVWRLAPYLDYAWPTMMAEYSSSMVSRLNAEYEVNNIYGPATAGATGLGIAQVPCFGLNSIYLGGDSYHGGSAITDQAPWKGGKLAATRLGQVKSAGTLVVFASCAARPNLAELNDDANQDLNYLGYAALRPPHIYPQSSSDPATPASQWIDPGDASEWRHVPDPASTGLDPIEFLGTGRGGLPVDRFADPKKQHAVESKASVGHLDGSVGTETIGRLGRDLSRWSPFIVGND